MGKMFWDVRCERCDHVWEEHKEFSDPDPECPQCGSNFTHTMRSLGQLFVKAKDPYDYINGRIPDAKPIKSFAKDYRRGGKDR